MAHGTETEHVGVAVTLYDKPVRISARFPINLIDVRGLSQFIQASTGKIS